MKEFNRTNEIFTEFWKNRIKLVIIAFSVGLITFLATFLITPQYKSVSIVYPVNIYPASDESATEQLLQYFNSFDVKWAVAQKFHLFEHYGIDTNKQTGGRALFEYMYSDFIKISPTLYESVEITVKDKSANYAQQINGGILDITNHAVRNNKRYVLEQYIRNIHTTLNMQSKSMDSLIATAKADETIMDESSEKQASDKKSKKMKRIKQKEYETKIKSLGKSYEKILRKRDKFYMDYTGDLTFFTIVSHPTLTDKRCYPVRSIFTVAAVVSSMILSMAVILIRLRLRKKNA